MGLGHASFSTLLDRILSTAADNLRVAKILVQMGLDPTNITIDILFNRLTEIVLAKSAIFATPQIHREWRRVALPTEAMSGDCPSFRVRDFDLAIEKTANAEPLLSAVTLSPSFGVAFRRSRIRKFDSPWIKR